MTCDDELPCTRAALVQKAKKYGLRGIWRWDKEKLYQKINYIETALGKKQSSSDSNSIVNLMNITKKPITFHPH